MQWNSTLYDQKHDFVAKYGEGLLTFLPENPAQAILDLGCGTGTLTAQLAARGSRVVGVDSARTMVERAKVQYPELAFQVCDALSLPFEGEFDVVFSNAVFHWIADHDTLLENVRKALKPGGQLICEFGGAGNIAAVEQAFNRACEELELAVRAPRFNFPTPEEFSARLARHGLAPVQVYDYDRPTPLKDGEQGLANWMRQFLAGQLEALPEQMGQALLARAEELARPKLWDGGHWTADYRRLRAVARKPVK